MNPLEENEVETDEISEMDTTEVSGGEISAEEDKEWKGTRNR